MKSVIHLEKVCFCRKDRTILDRIDWRVEPGQHWALLGANGSGKSTLLKILTGYEWPTFGQVTVQDRRFGSTDIGKLRRTIGLVSSSLEYRLPDQDQAIEIVGVDEVLLKNHEALVAPRRVIAFVQGEQFVQELLHGRYLLVIALAFVQAQERALDFFG